MVHFLCWVFLLVVSWSQDPQQNVGTKVVWRHTISDTATSETTVYTMGDRRRTEYRNTAQRRDTLREPLHPVDPPANVVIQRCDLGQAFELNTHTKEYVSKIYPSAAEKLNASDSDEPDWNTSTLPAVRVETTTVDTGERKEILGQMARHVVVTRRATPLNKTKNGAPSVSVSDGWYVDYERVLSCEPPTKEPKFHDFVWGWFGGPRVFLQRTENVTVGGREGGLLVKNASGNDTGITEFYRGPLDPALFEVPPDFTVVDEVGWPPIQVR